MNGDSALTGRLILVIGPSGAGKDSLIAAARRRYEAAGNHVFPQRVVSRPASSAEDNAHVAADEMEQRNEDGAYALFWRAHGHCYAIPRDIESALAKGAQVIINVSRTVVEQARASYPTFVIEVTASPETLAARLGARARPSDGNVADRLARATAVSAVADAVVRNEGSLAEAEDAFCALVAPVENAGLVEAK